jgi:ATP-binding cassette subfamily B protein
MDLEYGYDTYLHERGINLSVGQRQLLSFARAIITDPKILILDEATANIDSHTEVMIQKAMTNLLRGRTSIVIAHRLSTIRDADKIVVLQNGEVIETGNHAELMRLGGLYSHLYQMNYKSIESTINTDDNYSNGNAVGYLENMGNFAPAVVNPKIKYGDRVVSRMSGSKKTTTAS